MRSRIPKVLHELGGRPLLAWVLDAAREATGADPVVVVSPATAAVREAFGDAAVWAVQDVPRGTADAVRAGLAAVPAEVEEILVLSGDVPRIEAETLRRLAETRRLDAAVMTLLVVDAIDPTGYGRIVRTAGGSVERIVEEKDADAAILEISEINAGTYAFDAAWLRRRIGDVEPSPATGELYLTELVALARAEGRLVTSLDIEDDGRQLGINDRVQLAQAEWDLRMETNTRLMRAGVTMLDPSTVYADPDVEVATDVVLEPFVVLRGRTRIGEGTRIGAGSQIIDSTIGRECRVWASVVEGSTVGDRVTIGPFSHLRPGSIVDDEVEIGNYAEIKNSHLGRRVKQHHMSYLGDAEVGEETNVGAGTITANYDGRRKHRTTIGRRVFLGVDTMLRAPITVGDGAKTGAGAVVTHDVPPGTLVVGVPARIREPRPGASGEDADATAAGADAAAGAVRETEPAAEPVAGDGTTDAGGR
jgi:bifunctional UDP-N-acetylglucosamine pyrophosphorylase/glucosamine-1-phosphate N-acetyltransferase